MVADAEPSSSSSPSFPDALVAFVQRDVATDGDPIERSTDLLLSGRVDSLGVVMIVDWIEQRLGVSIDPGEILFEHFVSVEAIVDFLGDRVPAEPSIGGVA